MKSKTIKNTISNKINDWLEHIDDDEIKKVIKNETIVTGGAIASMLLQENVNDFDIYFKSKSAVKKICQYYQKLLEKDFEQKPYDILDGKDWCGFDYYNFNISEFGEEFSYAKARAAHLLEQDRIKLFPRDENGFLKIDNEEEKKYYPKFISPNAITLDNDIQLIIRFHGSPNKIHENYDFVHATNYYTYNNHKLVLRKDALQSLLEKELKYIGSKYPITSLIRTKKFVRKGFSIGAGEYLKMAYQVSNLNLNDVVVLEDQLAGVDIVYFEELIKILKETNTELNYNRLAKIIDKIFFDED